MKHKKLWLQSLLVAIGVCCLSWLSVPSANAQDMVGRILSPDEIQDGIDVVFEARSGVFSKGHYLCPYERYSGVCPCKEISSILEVPDEIVWTLVKAGVKNTETGLDQYYIKNKKTGLYLTYNWNPGNNTVYTDDNAVNFVSDTADAKAFCIVSNADATWKGQYGSTSYGTSRSDWTETTYTVVNIFPAGVSTAYNGDGYGRMFICNNFETAGYKISWYSQYQDTNVWDIRRVTDRGADPKTSLEDLLDNFQATTDVDYEYGTDPGYIASEELTNNFLDTYSDALQMLDKSDVTDEQYTSMFDKVYAAKQAVDNDSNTVQIEDGGYYYIKTAYSAFTSAANGEYAWMAPYNSSNVGWKAFKEGDNQFVWQFKEDPDLTVDKNGEREDTRMYYTIQNVGSKLFIGRAAAHSDSQPVNFLSGNGERMFVKHLNRAGQFNIGSKYDYYEANPPRPYHMEGHNLGAGTEGRLVLWDAGTDSPSAWYIRKVPDEIVAKIGESAKFDELRDTVAKYEGLTTNAVAGDGFCQPSSQATIDSLDSAMTRGKALIAASTVPTGEVSEAAIAAIVKAATAFLAEIKPVPEGYYFIHSGYTAFKENAGSEMGMYADEGQMKWKAADESDPKQYFYLKRLDNGNYLIRNSLNKQYANTREGDGCYAPNLFLYMTDTIGAEQILTPLYNGNFYISNTANKLPYHPEGQGNGSGTAGYVIPASVYTQMSEWTFVAADSTKFNSLVDAYNKQRAAAALNDSLQEVYKTIISIKAPNPGQGLITSASQLSSNCVWQDGYDVNTLLDGNHNTLFHSTLTMNLFTDTEYIQADLGRDDVQNFVLEYWGRNDGAGTVNSWHDNPNKIIILGTNTPDDESSWTEVVTLDEGFPANIDNAHYVSPRITPATPYRYYRFVVKSTTSGWYYWNISEFQLYDQVPASETSLYTTAANVKAAVDAVEAGVAVAEDHVKNLTVDGTEMDAINKSLAALQEIQNTNEKVQAAIDEAKALDRKLYEYSEDGYIKVVNTHNDGTNQLSANATWTTIGPDNDNYSFNKEFIEDGYNLLGALIDKDDQTFWHSDPYSHNLNTTENYLQIDLKESDVASFRIRIDRRNDFYNGANRHGESPTKAFLYGTNDDSIGNDIDGACSKWDLIKFIDDLPATYTVDSEWPYVSDVITPKTPYRYLRFRCTSATNGTPYWVISGFQILPGDEGAYDQEHSQYYYVDGMKDAADKMMSLANSAQDKINNGTVTISDTTELKAAIAAVRALVQDTTELSALLQRARFVAANATVGEGMGEVPDIALIDDLNTAIDNAEGGDTNTAALNAKTQALEDAYEAVESGVNGISTDKWYYILSATAGSDVAAAGLYASRSVKGAALYVMNSGNGDYGALVGTYASGNQLRWGLDNWKNIDRKTDIDAMWRFVPAPDSLGKRVYYVQNLHNGMYIGWPAWSGDTYYNSVNIPCPYRLDFIGGGQFNLVPLTGICAGIPISFGDQARQVRGDAISLALNNRASLTFEPVSDETTTVPVYFNSNRMSVISLPFAVSGINDNDSVVAYGIHSIIDETHIGLEKKDAFAAGEPMILLRGDTTATTYKATAISVNMPPVEISLDADTVNGLISALMPITLSKAGYGYISGSQLQISTDAGVGIPYFCGYIDDDLIQNKEGDPDAVLTVLGDGLLNKVARVETKAGTNANARVNVYTIDGTLVKKGVSADGATKGLRRGIYIVGKRKVLVK